MAANFIFYHSLGLKHHRIEIMGLNMFFGQGIQAQQHFKDKMKS